MAVKEATYHNLCLYQYLLSLEMANRPLESHSRILVKRMQRQTSKTFVRLNKSYPNQVRINEVDFAWNAPNKTKAYQSSHNCTLANETIFILSAKFDCLVASQDFSLLATVHDCETSLLVLLLCWPCRRCPRLFC